MSLLYFDTSALVKLVAAEAETSALLQLLESRPQVISSVLARVELLRAVNRAGRDRQALALARGVLERVTLLEIDLPIQEAAATLPPAELRSLDAIHLASATALTSDLDAFVGYDAKLNQAARAAGLTVLAPG